jgi:3-oxoacyl-[acyl-carrier-protein] synthase-1
MAERRRKVRTITEVMISPNETILNGAKISVANIMGLYREFVGDYPKFFKMDPLCKLGFLGAEMLFKNLPIEQCENAAIILFNRSGSLIADRNYQQTLRSENYFPSPALFVYTLANIVTGEIAIRHKIYGESSFYILDEENQSVMDNVVESAYLTSNPSMILTGWIEYTDDSNYIAHIKLVTNNN